MKRIVALLIFLTTLFSFTPSAFATQKNTEIDVSELYGEWKFAQPPISYPVGSGRTYMDNIILCEGGIGLIKNNIYSTDPLLEKYVIKWRLEDEYIYIEGATGLGYNIILTLKVEKKNDDIILTDCFQMGLIEARSQTIYRTLLADYERNKADFAESYESAFKSGNEQDQAKVAVLDYILDYTGNISSFDDLVEKYNINRFFLNLSNDIDYIDILAWKYLIIKQSEDFETSMAYFQFPKIYYEKS